MLKTIDSIQLQIVKMEEKAIGNTQVFCRALRTDILYNSPFDKLSSGYDLICFQTKFKLSLEECMRNSWMEISLFARFCGIEMKDIKLVNFTPNEIEFITKQDHLWRS